VIHLAGPNMLAKNLNMMNPRRCMSWGILAKGRASANIAPKDRLKKDEISRTRDNFEYPSGLAILMIDVDEPVPFNELL
jgi:hypothetical protein